MIYCLIWYCHKKQNHSERTKISKESTKEACVARIKTEFEDKECLKTIRSCLLEANVIRESEEPQKPEFEDWKLKLVKSCYSEYISL